MEDKHLIVKILNGDVESFRELYKRYSVPAWNMAMYICSNETLAKDALQNSFTSAFKYLSSFRHQASFKTWLLRIVHNECIRIMKAESRYRVEDHRDDHFEERSDLASIEVELTHRELSEQIALVLAKMKEPEALVLKLFYLEELAIKEITEIMNIRQSNVKVLLHRARINFRNSVKSSNLAAYNEST